MGRLTHTPDVRIAIAVELVAIHIGDVRLGRPSRVCRAPRRDRAEAVKMIALREQRRGERGEDGDERQRSFHVQRGFAAGGGRFAEK